MSIKIKSTKTFKNLPCAHAQHFDRNSDGSVGQCAAVHGYDREVTITFAGEVDEHGWVYPFGGLKPVKEWLEWYFDHVTLLPADDPRVTEIPHGMLFNGGLFDKLRVLPYGVSMEMSALFAWEVLNPYIYHTTAGRCYIEKLEFREHERNSAFLEVDEATAKKQAMGYEYQADLSASKKRFHTFVPPKDALNELNKV